MEHLKWHAFEIKRADVEYDIERMRDIDSQAEQMISAMVENLIKGEI